MKRRQVSDRVFFSQSPGTLRASSRTASRTGRWQLTACKAAAGALTARLCLRATQRVNTALEAGAALPARVDGPESFCCLRGREALPCWRLPAVTRLIPDFPGSIRVTQSAVAELGPVFGLSDCRTNRRLKRQ